MRLFYAVFVSHLPPSSFLEGLSSEQFEGLGLFSSGLFFDLPVYRGFVLSSLQGCLDILSFFFGFILRPFSDSVDFSYSKGSFFLFFSGHFFFFFNRAFLSGSVLSSTLYIGLLCLLRIPV